MSIYNAPQILKVVFTQLSPMNNFQLNYMWFLIMIKTTMSEHASQRLMPLPTELAR